MNKIFSSIVLILFILFPLCKKSRVKPAGKIEGFVMKNGAGLENAEIEILGSGKILYSEKDGHFQFDYPLDSAFVFIKQGNNMKFQKVTKGMNIIELKETVINIKTSSLIDGEPTILCIPFTSICRAEDEDFKMHVPDGLGILFKIMPEFIESLTVTGNDIVPFSDKATGNVPDILLNKVLKIRGIFGERFEIININNIAKERILNIKPGLYDILLENSDGSSAILKNFPLNISSERIDSIIHDISQNIIFTKDNKDNLQSVSIQGNLSSSHPFKKLEKVFIIPDYDGFSLSADRIVVSDDGDFNLNIPQTPSGTVKIKFFSAAHYPETVSVDLKNIKKLNVKMKPSFRLYIRVSDSSGKTVSVNLKLSGTLEKQILTSDDEILLKLPYGSYTISLTGDSLSTFEQQSLNILLDADQQININLCYKNDALCVRKNAQEMLKTAYCQDAKEFYKKLEQMGENVNDEILLSDICTTLTIPSISTILSDEFFNRLRIIKDASKDIEERYQSFKGGNYEFMIPGFGRIKGYFDKNSIDFFRFYTLMTGVLADYILAHNFSQGTNIQNIIETFLQSTTTSLVELLRDSASSVDEKSFYLSYSPDTSAIETAVNAMLSFLTTDKQCDGVAAICQENEKIKIKVEDENYGTKYREFDSSILQKTKKWDTSDSGFTVLSDIVDTFTVFMSGIAGQIVSTLKILPSVSINLKRLFSSSIINFLPKIALFKGKKVFAVEAESGEQIVMPFIYYGDSEHFFSPDYQNVEKIEKDGISPNAKSFILYFQTPDPTVNLSVKIDICKAEKLIKEIVCDEKFEFPNNFTLSKFLAISQKLLIRP